MHMFHNLQVWLQRILREVWYLMELSYSTVCACTHAIIWWRREVRKARRYFFLKSKDFHTKTENRDFSSFMFWIKYLLQYLAQLFSWMHSIFIISNMKTFGTQHFSTWRSFYAFKSTHFWEKVLKYPLFKNTDFLSHYFQCNFHLKGGHCFQRHVPYYCQRCYCTMLHARNTCFWRKYVMYYKIIIMFFQNVLLCTLE